MLWKIVPYRHTIGGVGEVEVKIIGQRVLYNIKSLGKGNADYKHRLLKPLRSIQL